MLVWIATDSTPTPPSASEETAVAPPGRGPRGAGRDQTQVAASTTASPSWQCGECALRAAEARVWCPSVTYEQTISDVDRVLASLAPADLQTRRVIQANDVSVLEAIYHVVEHFSMHTGQIILLAKADQPDRVRFYELVDGHPRLTADFHGRTPIHPR